MGSDAKRAIYGAWGLYRRSASHIKTRLGPDLLFEEHIGNAQFSNAIHDLFVLEALFQANVPDKKTKAHHTYSAMCVTEEVLSDDR
jgi:hypothetical protein